MGRFDETQTSPVRRRKVFYIPGYDPIHPRRYRELYRKEGQAQAEISGYALGLQSKKGQGRFGWHVTSQMDGLSVDSDVEVLVWSDIVRDSMSGSIPATYGALIITAWEYIATGALWRLMQLRKGPIIAALYPVGMLLVQGILALCLAWACFNVMSNLSDWIGALAHMLGAVFGSVLGWLLLRWFKAKDGKIFAYYLMHDYAYSARHKGANPPELETRMAEFREEIAQALNGDFGEVLVVGHSSGAHLGVSILADLIREKGVSDTGPALGFLSLGQVVPMVSFLRHAHRLRTDLNFLCQRNEVTWIDVTAPGDGCAFALCDPVSVSGVAPNKGKRWPIVFSAQFTQALSPERWKELRWKFFRLHFQYLCAFDRPKDYDYFQITAGPETLRARYENRPPSSSRMERPVSKFTSLAP